MYVIDLKDRTVAEFSQDGLFSFSKTLKEGRHEDRYWVVETKEKAIQVIKKLIKKGF